MSLCGKKGGIANFWPFLSRIKAATKERKEPAIFYLLFLQIPAPKTPSPSPFKTEGLRAIKIGLLNAHGCFQKEEEEEGKSIKFGDPADRYMSQS